MKKFQETFKRFSEYSPKDMSRKWVSDDELIKGEEPENELLQKDTDDNELLSPSVKKDGELQQVAQKTANELLTD